MYVEQIEKACIEEGATLGRSKMDPNNKFELRYPDGRSVQVSWKSGDAAANRLFAKGCRDCWRKD